VEFVGVSKSFGDLKVLEDIDLTINEGHITTIIGKSGVGKSVLLKHIIGLLQPDSGQILFRGRPVSRMSSEERRALKHEFAYMFQHNALFDSMTVFENVALPLTERTKLPEKEIRRRVLQKIEELELTNVAESYPSQISGGMQKRVALARALITEPRIVLFDEPTTGLDPIRKNAVLSMIAHYRKRFGFTAVLVSHDIPDVFYISERIAILDERRIIFQGEPMLLEQEDDEAILQFLNSLETLKDQLTGLDTRQQIERRFAREMERVPLTGHALSIMVVTCDELEIIKDRIGHIAAQRVIQGLAELLDESLMAKDTSGRYTPTSIVTILPQTDLSQAERLRERLAGALEGREIVHTRAYPGRCFPFTIHAGIAQAGQGVSLPDLIGQAERNAKQIATLECVQRH
jgi:phospholipid/cholesterol/gamma-HCH transport system ATP-binding protein